MMRKRDVTIVSDLFRDKLLSRFMRLLAGTLALIYLFGFGWSPPGGAYSLLYIFLVVAFVHRGVRPNRGLYPGAYFSLTALAALLVMLEQGQLAITQFYGRPNMPMSIAFAAFCLLAYDLRQFFLHRGDRELI